MTKKSFFGIAKPQFPLLRPTQTVAPPLSIDPPRHLSLYVELPADEDVSPAIKVGDTVAEGQRLQLTEGPGAAAVCPLGGTIAAVNPVTGDFGRRFLQVAIDTEAAAEPDAAFAAAAASETLDTLTAFFGNAPGKPPLALLADSETPITTLLISGVDEDVMTATRQHIVVNRSEAIERGVAVLKAATGITDVVLAVARDTLQSVGTAAFRSVSVPNTYPYGLPQLMIQSALGIDVPAGTSWTSMGICIISVEAVAAIGQAFAEKRLPTRKMLSLIDKSGDVRLVEATIGTPIGDVLAAAGITTEDRDRIVAGGPMRGSAVWSLAAPVMADTDAVMVQDSTDLPRISTYPCINCGDCIPVCPARIQVPMLVRFLEAGQYQDAVDMYDLLSCVECGLCSYYCVAQIPIFQYIRLAKFEIARIQQMEEANV